MKTTKPLKIFIVNEDMLSASIYEQYIYNIGHTDVSVFNNGISCMYNLTQKPDIIFLDQGTDVATSLEILKKIKQIDYDVYVIFLVDEENMQTAINAFKYGAFECVVKSESNGKNIKYILEKISAIGEMLHKQN